MKSLDGKPASQISQRGIDGKLAAVKSMYSGIIAARASGAGQALQFNKKESIFST